MSGAARLIPLAELEASDLGAWRELAERAVEPNPFFDPDFVLPAARGLGEYEDVAVAVAEGPDGWAACLPVRRYRRWHGFPIPCLASWRHPYCLLGTPLLDSGEPGALERLLGALIGGDGSRLGAGLDWVAGDGVASQALAGAPPRTVELDRYERAYVRRRPDDDYLEGSVKGKHRREFRRLAAGLATELGGELEVVERIADPAAIELFLDLEAAGWKGKAGSALASDPAHAEFFRETAGLLGSRGRAELTFLQAGGSVAAARFSLRQGGVLFCFKVAYDEALKRFSPGREIELRQLAMFHADPELVAMDSCTAPDNELFNRLWPDRRPIATCWVPGGGLAGRSAAAALGIAARRRAAA